MGVLKLKVQDQKAMVLSHSAITLLSEPQVVFQCSFEFTNGFFAGYQEKFLVYQECIQEILLSTKRRDLPVKLLCLITNITMKMKVFLK